LIESQEGRLSQPALLLRSQSKLNGAGYSALLAAFALACTMLATRASRAYRAQV
jgi:hypothetical protein